MTRRPKTLLVGAAMFLAACGAIANEAPACVAETSGLAHMKSATLSLVRTDGSVLSLAARIADDPQERAAGFQHICADTMATTAILFVFPADTHASFHMSNVPAALDIAFLDAGGRVDEVQRMEPYVSSLVFTRQRLYRPAAPFRFALETAAGRLGALGVTRGASLIEPENGR